MATIAGSSTEWHKVTLDFRSAQTFAEEPVTFRDHRLDVTFTNAATGETIIVPGFFAADGEASETGATAGNVWRVNFNPPSDGDWSYSASFRKGTDIAALSYEAAQTAGSAQAITNGAVGTFSVAETDKTGEDFRAKGMILQDEGTHYLQHQGDGDYFVRGGPGVPENLLASADFDGWRRGFSSPEDATPGADANGHVARHQFAGHRGDFAGTSADLWSTDDENTGDGRGIFGAVDYLASQGQNTIYLLTNTIGGDGKDVGPWTGRDLYSVKTNAKSIADAGLSVDDVSTYDVSKLEQWERLFDYMDDRQIYKNVLFQETENERLLNGGTADPMGSSLSVERKVYMREMIARFGHNNGIQWNLGEENNDQSHQERADMAAWTKLVDPYDHLVVIHTYGGAHQTIYGPLLDDEAFDGPSFQTGASAIRGKTIDWREKSAAAGDPWVISWDEDSGSNADVSAGNTNPDETRALREGFWGHLTAGGTGANWYLKGNGFGGHSFDQNLDDFRPFEVVWKWTEAATTFFNQYIPFWAMETADDLTANAGDYVLAAEGEYYVVYLDYGQADDVRLDLRGQSGERFDAYWYDPRNGGSLIEIGKIDGGTIVDFPGPPNAAGKDWVLFVRNEDLPNTPPSVPPSDDPTPPPQDPPSPPDDFDITLFLIDPGADTSEGPLVDGAVIDLAGFPQNISVEARPSESGVGSAVFRLNGTVIQTENIVPYAMFGDTSGDFKPGDLTPGSYTLAVEMYSGVKGSGVLLGSTSVGFDVVSETVTPPDQPGPVDPGPVDPGPTTPAGAFLEVGGLVVIEMESADDLPGAWRDRATSTSSPNIDRPDAAAGDDFIVWEGSQSLGRPGNGLITYQVQITTPGLYTFDWYNQVGRGTNSTEHNDTWLKIEADAFYAVKPRSVVAPKGADPSENDYPAGAGTPNGSGRDGWFKVYSSSAKDWRWSARTSDNDAHEIVARFDAPGTYDIKISARSSSHVIDRMILVNKSVYSGNARDLALEESARAGGDTPPTPPNNAPDATDDKASTTAGQAVVVDVLKNDGDADGDSLKVASVATPANGSVTIVPGGVRYLPDAGFSGTDAFDYTVDDGAGGTATATVTVTVAPPPNTAPDAADDNANTAAEQAVVVDVLKNDGDADGDSLTIASVAAPANGSVSIVSGGVRYLPDAGFSGTDAFDYTVSDGAGGTATATVTVTVAPPPPPGFDPSSLSFRLLDSRTKTVIDDDLRLGETVDPTVLPDAYEIEVLGLEGTRVDSIVTTYGTHSRLENYAPFTVFKSSEHGEAAMKGSQALKLDFYSADRALGDDLGSLDFAFEIGGEPPRPPRFDASEVSYILVDGSGAVIDAALTDGEIVSLAGLPETFSIEAIGVDGNLVESMRIEDGSGGVRIENFVPWTIFKSESVGMIFGGENFDLTLFFYGEDRAQGDLIAETSLSFSISVPEITTTPTTGGPGDDLLPGTSGDDVIITGAGADTVIYGGGTDTITDFALGSDTLELVFNGATRRLSTTEEFLTFIEELENMTVPEADAYVKGDNLVLEPTNSEWIEFEKLVDALGRSEVLAAGADII